MIKKEIKRQIDKRDINFDTTFQQSSIYSGESDVVPAKEIIDAITISENNLSLTGLSTIGGVSVEENHIVLVNSQTDKKENGLYYASSSSWERVGNDLNDVKLIKIIDGDYNSNLYTLKNEPIIIGTDDIEYKAIFTPNSINVLSIEYPFDNAALTDAITTQRVIIPAITGYTIDLISCYMKRTYVGFDAGGDGGVTYENGNNYTYPYEFGILGTGADFRKIFELDGAVGTNFTTTDNVVMYNPSYTFFAGTITGKFYITYRYIKL